MNVVVSADDVRAIEVLASGLPMQHGAQLAIDIAPLPPTVCHNETHRTQTELS